jgi:hypothetical protein
MRSTDKGIGDSIRKAADDAMKDLGDNSLPPDDGHKPQPGNEADDVRVHSSISEGSNAGEDGDDAAPYRPADDAARDSTRRRPDPEHRSRPEPPRVRPVHG